MARNRMIKPEFCADKVLARVSRDARLLFIGMWMFSDDYGVIKAKPSWIQANVFEEDDTAELNLVKKWLNELERIRAIIKFLANGKEYYFIRTFLIHQKVDKPSKTRNPEPPDDILDTENRESSEAFDDEVEIEREVEIEKETSSKSDEGKKEKKCKEKFFDASSDEFEMAALLWNLIEENNPKAKEPDIYKWASEVDKMIRIDGRTRKEIDFIIRWAQKDNFWKANILSTAKLREKFDQLWIKAKSQYEKTIQQQSKTAFIS